MVKFVFMLDLNNAEKGFWKAVMDALCCSKLMVSDGQGATEFTKIILDACGPIGLATILVTRLTKQNQEEEDSYKCAVHGNRNPDFALPDTICARY